MTVAIAAKFPTGRYHATPWGRSVNEATVEWPPSPWRLLRGLYATWQDRAPDLSQEHVEGLLGALAGAPSYRLPRCAEAHTRHYYPDAAAGTDKVFDPFAALDPTAELVIRWPAAVTSEQRTALERLCAALPYLGRADSLCQARVLSDGELTALGAAGWCEPGDLGDLDQPAARVLVPAAPLDLTALLVSTLAVRAAGRTSPAGARWISYPVPRPDTAPRRPPARRQAPPTAPTAMAFTLDAPALPSHHAAVTYAHVLRRAALQRLGTGSTTLSGRAVTPENRAGADAPVRRDNHSHAHYLLLDADGDRLLDTAVVWAPEGLSDDEVTALGSLRRLTSNQPGFRPVRIAARAAGDVTALLPTQVIGARQTGQATDTWVSITPFAPYRHRGRRPLEVFLRDEVARELATRQMPAPVSVQLVSGGWLDYARRRSSSQSQLIAHGLRIILEEAVRGPLSLGALSHFGLGLFGGASR